MADPGLSRVVRGQVMHRRRRPVENRFVYPVFFLLLNTDRLEALDSWLFAVNRRRALAFWFADHGDGRDPRLWVREQLARNGISDCTGAIWVQSFPRVFGFVFNPVSFWYCRRGDGSVGAIVAEVNNTFGERHCYVLTPDRQTGRFRDVRAPKALYVSPFYPVRGEYRFHFNTDFDAPRVRIDYFDDGRLQLNTAVWGRARALSSSSLLAALVRQPLLTLGVIARIHWQALRLWVRGVALFDRPTRTVREITK
jgi:hypothetical protein